MASLIPGYEYDIFISYRQKDNRGDKWVSRFVDALRTELDATFKEDISVYFDENPHDRLQETHDVDKSLEGKLKCLIFIPILSQTYCDPNSYAWKCELMTFLRMAENDQYGKNIKLRSGNVASRILPVRIHDIEKEDIQLFEKETGSVLRALDFVFKTGSGAIRPLLPNEDHPNDNLAKTFYRDQISKVAIAIKEIITGMKTGQSKAPPAEGNYKAPEEKIREKIQKTGREKPGRKVKPGLITAVTAAVLFIIVGVIVYPGFFKGDALERLKASGERISVAVMPFQNMTNDTVWNVWQDGIQDMLITTLSNSSGDMIVRKTETINNLLKSKSPDNYASVTPALARSISQKLDANVFIYGNIKQAGSLIRVYAQLIDSKTVEVIKSFLVEGEAKEDNIFKVIDSLSLMVSNYLVISLLEKELPEIYRYTYTTNSPEAYRYFMYGNKSFTSRDYTSARNLYQQALYIDTNFTMAAVYISLSYSNQELFDQAKKWCLQVYSKRNQMPLKLQLVTEWMYAHYFETPFDEIRYLEQLTDIDDYGLLEYFLLGNNYIDLNQYDKAIPEYEKTLELSENWGIKPIWVFSYTLLGNSYHETGQYRKERRLYKKAQKDYPGDPFLLYNQAVLELSLGRMEAGNRYIEKYRSARKDQMWSEARIISGVANIFFDADIPDKAEENYRKALSLEPENPGRLTNLAYFLINTDRNIEEGLTLADKALKLRPDNFIVLDTKGWGLYKQGNYKDALYILEKSWELRRQNSIYDHTAFLHLEAAKKALAGLN